MQWESLTIYHGCVVLGVGGGYGDCYYTDRFLKTDRKDPATLGMDEAMPWEVPPLRDEGSSGGIELRPMSEPSIRLMM